jgi:predicted dehydrogenase
VFALKAFEAGLHVMTEKPMAITLASCRTMRDAAARAGRKLAVAENFRRDPMNRLAKALLDSGAIGKPFFAIKMGVGGGDSLMHNTGWRARRDRAGSHILENAVHDCDLLIYFLGPVDTIFAETAVCFTTRRRAGVSGQIASFYRHRVEDEFVGRDEVEVDTEDSAFGVVRFKSGVIGQLTFTAASVGYRVGVNSVHGSEGTLLLPPSRSGQGPELLVADGRASIKGDELIALVPDFQLDDATAAFWDGRRRMASYDMPFDQIDARLVAIEYQDFAEAIASGREPEVGATEGMEALALAYGLLESGKVRQAVSLGDVLTGSASRYQSELGVD